MHDNCIYAELQRRRVCTGVTVQGETRGRLQRCTVTVWRVRSQHVRRGWISWPVRRSRRGRASPRTRKVTFKLLYLLSDDEWEKLLHEGVRI